MHEMSIVQALLEQVEIEVEKSGETGKVRHLELIIGRLSGVHVDSIRFAFELLSPDSIAEGAELRISEPPAHIDCRSCGAKPVIGELIATCPECGSAEISIQGGQELLLQSIELEQE